MGNTVSVAVRLDKNLKDGAVSILDGLGVDLTTAFRMFLSQVVLKKGLPFGVSYPDAAETSETPNEATIAAVRWIEAHKKSGRRGFRDTEELFKSWGRDA